MKFTLTDSQGINLAINPLDKKGNPAAVQGFAAVIADPTLGVVKMSETNPKGFSVEAAGPIGTTQVTVTADADLGEGVENIVGTIDFEFVAGKAVSLGFVQTGDVFELP